MKPVEFPEQTLVIAKDQPQYIPIPAFQHHDAHGRITWCVALTWRERLKVLVTGKIWQQVCTFGCALQPQKIMADKPEMVQGEPYNPRRRLEGAL